MRRVVVAPSWVGRSGRIIGAMELLADDLRIDVFRQDERAVIRIAHKPSGHVVSGEYGHGFPSGLAVKERLLTELRGMVTPLLHDEGAGL
jgi:hypothetical protein